MVTKAGVGLVLVRDPFLMLGQLHLSRKLAGDPKSIYFLESITTNHTWQGILKEKDGDPDRTTV